MNVSECLEMGMRLLSDAGVENPRADVEWLLASVLDTRRMQLYVDLKREVETARQRCFEALLQRRAGREPLQHLLGTAEFCGRLFDVNPFVLIPRPETELLADLAVQYLRKGGGVGGVGEAVKSESHQPRVLSVLDFGTGSGCLAITLALEMAGGRRTWVGAIDISAKALEVARCNARRHGCENAVFFFEGDGFSVLSRDPKFAEARFDLIVTNPPYIPSGEIAALQPEVRDWDPLLALDGGWDGLAFYRRLAGEAKAWLNSGGVLMAEFGEGQADAIVPLFREAGWDAGKPVKDDTGRLRILIARPLAS